jgi:hypothetical protein
MIKHLPCTCYNPMADYKFGLLIRPFKLDAYEGRWKCQFCEKRKPTLLESAKKSHIEDLKNATVFSGKKAFIARRVMKKNDN